MLKRSSVVSNLAANQPVSARLAATDHSTIFFMLLFVTFPLHLWKIKQNAEP
jgi:hypothetical protein